MTTVPVSRSVPRFPSPHSPIPRHRIFDRQCMPACEPNDDSRKGRFLPVIGSRPPPGATAIGGTVFTALNLVGRRAKIQVKTDPGCHDCAPISDESEFTPPARASKRNLARPANTASSEPPAVRSHTCTCSRAPPCRPACIPPRRHGPLVQPYCAGKGRRTTACLLPSKPAEPSAGHRSSVVPPRPAAA